MVGRRVLLCGRQESGVAIRHTWPHNKVKLEEELQEEVVEEVVPEEEVVEEVVLEEEVIEEIHEVAEDENEDDQGED